MLTKIGKLAPEAVSGLWGQVTLIIALIKFGILKPFAGYFKSE